MAARLTDKQKKRIVADYVDMGSYYAVAKKWGVSTGTVKRTVQNEAETAKKVQRKKEQNTADILAFMEARKEQVCAILGLGLDVLQDKQKLMEAPPTQITTMIGTLIDKWTAVAGTRGDAVREDALSRSLREMGEDLESDVE